MKQRDSSGTFSVETPSIPPLKTAIDLSTNTRTTNTTKISLAPNDILINVVHALNGYVSHLTSELDVRMTCSKSIDHVEYILGMHDRELTLHQVQNGCEKGKVKELAESSVEHSYK